MNRVLTSRFGSYRIGQYEKKTGKSILDLISMGNFEVNKLALLVKLGSPEISMDDDEKAYEKIDNYLQASENNSLITAFIDVINELNIDMKILGNVKLDSFKEKLNNKVNELSEKLENIEDEDFKIELGAKHDNEAKVNDEKHENKDKVIDINNVLNKE